jgi:hypothetical protein
VCAVLNAELLATTEQVQQLQRECLRGAVAAAAAAGREASAAQEAHQLAEEEGGGAESLIPSSDVQWQHTVELQRHRRRQR